MMSEHESSALSERSPAPPSRSCRSLKLAWTDADSGEQFIVSLRGGGELLGGLRQAGFELLEDAGSVDRGLPGPQVRAEFRRGAG